MTPTTPADLAELERLQKAYTDEGGASMALIYHPKLATAVTGVFRALPALLAAARQMPVLQAEVERLRAVNADIRAANKDLLAGYHAARNQLDALASLPVPAQAEPVARDLAEAAWNAALRTPTAPFELATLLLTRDRLDAIIRTVRAAPPPPASARE